MARRACKARKVRSQGPHKGRDAKRKGGALSFNETLLEDTLEAQES